MLLAGVAREIGALKAVIHGSCMLYTHTHAQTRALHTRDTGGRLNISYVFVWVYVCVFKQQSTCHATGTLRLVTISNDLYTRQSRYCSKPVCACACVFACVCVWMGASFFSCL